MKEKKHLEQKIWVERLTQLHCSWTVALFLNQQFLKMASISTFLLGILPKLAKYRDIWLRATNMPEWGIPEKSIKNIAQRR